MHSIDCPFHSYETYETNEEWYNPWFDDLKKILAGTGVVITSKMKYIEDGRYYVRISIEGTKRGFIRYYLKSLMYAPKYGFPTVVNETLRIIEIITE